MVENLDYGAWYGPTEVLHLSRELTSLSREEEKSIKEGVVIATFLIGMCHLMNEDPARVKMKILWQGEDKAPDGLVRIGDDAEFPVEVVNYTEFSHRHGESCSELLKRTKFSHRYAYPKDTVVLCYVDKGLWYQVDAYVEPEELGSANKKHSLFMVYDKENIRELMSVNGWGDIKPGSLSHWQWGVNGGYGRIIPVEAVFS